MNRYCFFIPFHNPVIWHTDYANQTARLLSEHHPTIRFLWADAVSLKEIFRDKASYRPIVHSGMMWSLQPLYLIPGKRFTWVQTINFLLNILAARLVMAWICIHYRAIPVVWMFGFFDPVFRFIPDLFPRTRILYDCVDHTWHPDRKTDAILRSAQKKLLDRAWIVTANSVTLTRILRRIRPDTVTVPLGFRIEMFGKPAPHRLRIPKNRPIIGYVGSIDYRLDYPLLIPLVRQTRGWIYLFVGPIFTDYMDSAMQKALEVLLRQPNVIHASVPPAAIPAILTRCTVTIIPYRTTIPFTRFCFPMKYMEYLFAGKPVISSAISELRNYPATLPGPSRDRWRRAISERIRNPLSEKAVKIGQSIAAGHSWEKKIDAIEALIRLRE